MKKQFISFILFLIFISGCKKDEDLDIKNTTNNTTNTTTEEEPENTIPLNFTANEALIKSSSDFYLIADVEGLTGITKLNIQERAMTCEYGWSSNACPGKSHCSGNFDFKQTVNGSSKNCSLEAGYYGTGEGRTGLITDANTRFITTAKEEHGVRIWYKAPDGNTYTTDLTNNTTEQWSSLQLAQRLAYGSSTGSSYMPGYYVKLKFNAELVSGSDLSRKIKLKNAIIRVAM